MVDFRTRLSTLKTPFIIGIAGDSGSGKTTYSNGIRRMFGTDLVKTITMDGYHKENRIQRLASRHLPLDPNVNNLELLKDHLTRLKKGETVNIPLYNHESGDFDPPQIFPPSPIIIVEGLHALYPDLLPLMDFTIYVDPSRDVKWKWKYERDTLARGHEKEELTREMLLREAAYKRWVDFQKTSADIVIKIYPSRIKEFAKYELISDIPSLCYKVELIIEPVSATLSLMPLEFDLLSMLSASDPPFLLAGVPSYYWGKRKSVIHIDGVLSQRTVKTLEDNIVSLTAIPVEKMLEVEGGLIQEGEKLTAVHFTQLLITWRFLEQVNQKLT